MIISNVQKEDIYFFNCSQGGKEKKTPAWNNLIVANYNITVVITIDFDCLIFTPEEGSRVAFPFNTYLFLREELTITLIVVTA